MLNLRNLKTNRFLFLRNKYPVFTFRSFNYQLKNNHLVISFLFKSSPDIEFEPSIKIGNVTSSIFTSLDKTVLENFVFHVGLIEMFSYWKATCSQVIEIEAGYLSQNQLNWWKMLLLEGLGEFFYKNNIDFTKKDFVEIKSSGSKIYAKDKSTHKNRYLVLNGGGRDSIVSIELLKNLEKEIGILMINPTKASLDIAKASQVNNKIIVEREIDKNLLALNQNDYLNGHTPFSAYLAFISSLCALLFDYQYSVSSNERSANEANTEFLGEKINHQYSKSYTFEKSYRDYLKLNLSDNLEYLSVLRPLYEIQISKVFANYNNYFGIFKSCNRAQKNNAWCGKCPKCLSIYTSLYAFIEKKELIKIFGADLYEKKELLNLLLHLTGVKKPKPFECVGTYKEILAGIYLSIEKLQAKKKQLPFLLQYSKENILSKNSRHVESLNAWDENHFLARNIAKALKMKIS